MKILQLCSARAFGGGERHVLDLSTSLQERGHQVFVAAREGAPLWTKLHDAKFPDANLLPFAPRNAFDLRGLRSLQNFVETRGIEIVHAHVARDYLLASLLCRLRERRGQSAFLIITRHVVFPMNRAHRLLLANARRVIAVSESVRTRLLRDGIFPENKIAVIPNGIRTDIFARNDSEERASLDETTFAQASGNLSKQFSIARKFMVGTLGELSETKNQAHFVRMTIKIARARDDVNFVIGGDDHSPDQNMRATLAAMIEAAGLKDRILLAGEIKDVPDFMRALDVFVSCSRVEAFGLVMVEAMASGVAVVATKTDGACEIIRDGHTGKLVAQDDVDALAASINQLLDDERLRNRLRAAGRDEALARFDLARVVERVERIYEQARPNSECAAQ